MSLLIELRDITRTYLAGDQSVTVLKNISLSIHQGEMIAIMGASGSGKSTLMNILGCLDHASSGDYLLLGKNIEHFNDEELAKLRREHFGFIFQRYHLLPHLNALQNVEIPAIYAADPKKKRQQRAQELLNQLGLSERLDYYPSQLSGGQQQRVSIARALMNGGEVILADEPTGALDSHARREVMDILKELHKMGHTIILVTHDRTIAEQTERIIEIADGEIVGEQRLISQCNEKSATLNTTVREKSSIFRQVWGPFSEAFTMAWRAMVASKMRTLLTMLGIIIGIASVVSVMIIGDAARRMVLNDIQSIGTNTVTIYPGKDFGDYDPMASQSLTTRDILALEAQDYVKAVSPVTSINTALKANGVTVNASVMGVNDQFFSTYGITMQQGLAFTPAQLKDNAQVVVITKEVQRRLFPNEKNVIGKVLLIGNMPSTIIGVANSKQYILGDRGVLQVLIPNTTMSSRILGQQWFSSITVRIKDGYSTKIAEQRMTQFLTLLHNKKDFFTYNMNSIVQTIERTANTLQLFLVLVAVISLVVGGVGVMNIMLVSVSERTREIGIRRAVGARASDILQQFLIEAVFVCLVGGVLGSMIAYFIELLVQLLLPQWTVEFSIPALLGAFICSTVVGVVFGYLPAKNAAKLKPIDALARE